MTQDTGMKDEILDILKENSKKTELINLIEDVKESETSTYSMFSSEEIAQKKKRISELETSTQD